MATSRIRHFVLVEPFRKADVSIFPDTPRGRDQADRLTAQYRNQGKRVTFVSSTGTVNDLGGTLAAAKADQ